MKFARILNDGNLIIECTCEEQIGRDQKSVKKFWESSGDEGDEEV